MRPFLKGDFVLQKAKGKGGWTYIVLPQPSDRERGKFGRTFVSGQIDMVPLGYFRLWAMKQGTLFMPVNAALRRKLGKSAGDTVRIALYREKKTVIPADFKACLADEPLLARTFHSMDEPLRRSAVARITNAATPGARVKVIAAIMNDLLKKSRRRHGKTEMDRSQI